MWINDIISNHLEGMYIGISVLQTENYSRQAGDYPFSDDLSIMDRVELPETL